MNPTKLSVVIITFNEERNIGRCIDSVAAIADEIVVLDSFSTDGTEQICKEKGAKFFQHKFDGHIEQKNRAITYATNPYVLSLDADEALDETLRKEIAVVKKDWQYDGYTMNRLTSYCGQWIKHSGWYPDAKLRLWDSRKGKWGGVNPHDKYELNDRSAKTKHLKGDILHYSYHSIEDHIKQTEKFSTISAQALFQMGKTSSGFHAMMKSWAKFFRNYVLKAGFLDGKYGYIICKISAQETRMRYKKLAELNRRKKVQRSQNHN
ncbi:MAG TPA: glycosyltransferase family 2 protein [Bacteroidia bacterium]|jgi:glycosyltransferase involved in cell wall biosynthesis|nr:glycosyltransferase family 2 protein [Bacteroidia bacterium]